MLLLMSLKVVSWTPMDAVSSCIAGLVFHNKRLPPVLNLVHPRPIDWDRVIRLIGDSLISQKRLDSPLSFVSFQTWFSTLEAHAKSANQENDNELRIVRLNFALFQIPFSSILSLLSNLLIFSDKCQQAIGK